jgi:MFS family permease
MAEPWFEPVRFGVYYGAIGGSVLGSLGGVLGSVSGWMSRRGRARGLVLGGFSFFALFGFVNLGLAAYALWTGQPRAIWYPMLLIGIVLAPLFTLLKPMVRKRYENFEMRCLVNTEPDDVKLR